MDHHCTLSQGEAQRCPPQYPSEIHLEARTKEKDRSALKLAHKALAVLRSKRTKAQTKPGVASSNDPPPKSDDSASRETPKEPQDVTDNDPTPLCNLTALQSDEEGPNRIIYGDQPDVMLHMKSMYEGNWPKRKDPERTAKQYSWSNIGFPSDKSLQIRDFEEDTTIDKNDPVIIKLAETVAQIKYRSARDIVEPGGVSTKEYQNRTIEEFTLNGWNVTKVKFCDIDVFAKRNGQTYSSSLIATEVEAKISEAIGAQPKLPVLRWATAHLLLAKGGEIGGRTDDYWKRAKNLAQQQLYLCPDLEREIQQQMTMDFSHDMAYSQMLDIVREALRKETEDQYFQAKRDAFAVESGLFLRIRADISIVLDQNDEMIAFQCSDAFTKTVGRALEKSAASAFETFSTLQAVPLPDMTRHGLHYIDWLAERPDLDFRNPQNNPRLAKSGVYHFGVRCAVGDPTGQDDPQSTKDSRKRIVYDNIEKQLHTLRYSALGVCTELVAFFFGILDAKLLEDYRKVAAEVTKLGFRKFETRRVDETFTLQALLVNLMTYDHRDACDWHRGLVGLVAVGSYEGGDLLLRDLGLRLESSSGCVQLIRGRELRHSITKWTGRRFVVVNTVHEAVRQWAFRRRGEVPRDPTTTTPFSAPCLDAECAELEDIIPEEQRVLSEREMHPHAWAMRHGKAEEDAAEDEEERGSSEADIPIYDKVNRRDRRVYSSSDASGETSQENMVLP
ncbi:hypothetical protein F5Y15DRAFT_416531 [Xylariaceae sp. FL0016]|nr:hypothetical protein F5Y15DRAFT_416531 [Xylariaceae sp. FL0016]